MARDLYFTYRAHYTAHVTLIPRSTPLAGPLDAHSCHGHRPRRFDVTHCPFQPPAPPAFTRPRCRCNRRSFGILPPRTSLRLEFIRRLSLLACPWRQKSADGSSLSSPDEAAELAASARKHRRETRRRINFPFPARLSSFQRARLPLPFTL